MMHMSNDLTFYDRQKLQYWLRTKQSLRAIARIMRKDHSVISREILRNGSRGRTGYRADLAQAQTERRRHARRRGKLEQYPALKEYVIDKLREDWSPEEIAGRSKAGSVSVIEGVTVSHETIYQYIYHKADRWEHLYRLLPQRRAKRRKWGSRRVKKAFIPERIPITERPGIVDSRGRYGDWESDTLEFKRTATKGAVSVQCERKAGLVRLHKLTRKKLPADTLQALIQTFESVPPELVKTCTFDNGTENYRHTELHDILDLETYFCQAYSAWQKGTVENANKLLRRYLPKDTALDALSDADLQAIQERLNNRPRKRLNYKTPNEVIQEYLQSGALLT
jgi:IS30 family transposase